MSNTYNKYFYLKNSMIPFYFFTIFHHVITVAVTNYPLPKYIPEDIVTIDCGSSGSNSALDGRIWEGDIDSKFFPSLNQNNASITYTSDQPPTQVGSVPYQTARLSRSEFTYIIPVTTGQKFIRLHFFLANSYGGFDSSKAFFSVKAAQHSLLSNFRASHTAYDLQLRSIIKEFCLHVENNESNLNITFTPVASNSESFAFINGIEVVSMPSNLYYSGSQLVGPKFVGQRPDIVYPIRYDTAMETVHRINVGGSIISPVEDTGMFRSWDLEEDYLTVPGYSVLPVDMSHDLSFKVIPPYTAPSQVYRTARSMGNVQDKALIRSYNLTWEFPVDTKFYYLVRLHFCEILTEVNRTGDRVFLIFLANNTAEKSADVILWSGGNYIPVYKDYVVEMFNEGGEKKVNLSVALQANPDDWKTAYVDAILNGVEIFKLNDTTGNLAGLDPHPSYVSPTFHQETNSQTVTTAVVSGVASGLALLSMIGLFI